MYQCLNVHSNNKIVKNVIIKQPRWKIQLSQWQWYCGDLLISADFSIHEQCFRRHVTAMGFYLFVCFYLYLAVSICWLCSYWAVNLSWHQATFADLFTLQLELITPSTLNVLLNAKFPSPVFPSMICLWASAANKIRKIWNSHKVSAAKTRVEF